eukprot:16449320-Heterocapsa_arctica.AAC.1
MPNTKNYYRKTAAKESPLPPSLPVHDSTASSSNSKCLVIKASPELEQEFEEELWEEVPQESQPGDEELWEEMREE